MTTPLEPEPGLPPQPRSGPTCSCGATAVAQWQRRPTEDELAALTEAETYRRGRLLTLADPEQPPPDFGPLPTAGDTTMAVYACADHAIHIDLAARIHEASCANCDCTPEPVPEPPADVPMVTLPSGWVIPDPNWRR